MAIFVVAHGAWSAGWAWKKMHPLMRAADMVGHADLYRPRRARPPGAARDRSRPTSRDILACSNSRI